ncbi:MAG: hypothetical protein ACRDZU_11770 [Acidimicrobiales bacterium]
MADHELERLQRISEALDGDGPMPEALSVDEAAFVASATHLRSMVRVEEAAVPPDVTDAVLARVRSRPPARSRSPRPLALVAAAVFVVAALVAALAVRPGGPLSPEPALADVGEEVLRAQQDVLALDAALTLVETGVHADVPVRRYEGTLRYQAPERLWLHLEDRTALPNGFPANDLDLVVDDGAAWSTGLRGCPIGEQPICLGGPVNRVVSGLAPFAADWVAPLDLVIPAAAFLPGTAVASSEVDGGVVIQTTVARLQRTIDGLRSAGALRSVHPTDAVRLQLDPESFTIQRLTVTAGDSGARAAWAASNGYTEGAGAPVLDLTVTERSLPDSPFPDAPSPADTDAGFADLADVSGPQPAWLPTGYSAHRGGTQSDGSRVATVRSWTDGRAWIRLEVTDGQSRDQLLGDLGPVVRRLPVGEGVGYADPAGSVVSLHAGTLDLAVTGSVPLDVLVRVAASLPVVGQAVPADWPQGDVLEALPSGALRPDGALTARYEGADLLVAVPGPGQTSAVLRQRPGSSLGAPGKADVVEVMIRGVAGRYEPRTQTVRWVEDGWIRELRSAGLALGELLAIAEALEAA